MSKFVNSLLKFTVKRAAIVMIHQIVSASAIGLNAARDSIFPGQNWVISENIDIPQFSNLTSTTTILLFKFNLR